MKIVKQDLLQRKQFLKKFWRSVRKGGLKFLLIMISKVYKLSCCSSLVLVFSNFFSEIAFGRALPKLRYLNTHSTIHIKKLNSIIVCTYPKLGRKIADPQSSLTSELLASTLAVEWAHPLFCPLILKKVTILLAINVQICNKNWLSTIEV